MAFTVSHTDRMDFDERMREWRGGEELDSRQDRRRRGKRRNAKPKKTVGARRERCGRGKRIGLGRGSFVEGVARSGL